MRSPQTEHLSAAPTLGFRGRAADVSSGFPVDRPVPARYADATASATLAFAPPAAPGPVPGRAARLAGGSRRRTGPTPRTGRVQSAGRVVAAVVEGIVAAVVGFTAGVLIMSMIVPGGITRWIPTEAREKPTPTVMMLEEGEDPSVLEHELRQSPPPAP